MTVVIIPAYNEEGTIADVIVRSLPYADRVLVVNDGSRDATAAAAIHAGAQVISHSLNRGLGAAIGTGIQAARRLGADIVITLDADGQHLPEEIPRFVEALTLGADAVIGSRMLMLEGNMPPLRRVYQHIGYLVTFLLFGKRVTDSQSGFRAFSGRAADAMDLQTDRMEVSSEIISEIHRRRLAYAEVPITAVYTDNSLRKGQSFSVGVKTAVKLFLHRLSG